MAAQPHRRIGQEPTVTQEHVLDAVEGLVIDSETDEAAPIPHRRVRGHLADTDYRFTISLPGDIAFEHRFYQCVYPLADENPSDNAIAFGADSGAYTVQTNADYGYQVDAAAAAFSKSVATRHYGTAEQIHGYIYGASGGSYQTIAAMENTSGIWDGGVPMVIGAMTSIPNNFFIRAFARLILSDKAPLIADAVAPGGSGNPFAHLDPVEAEVLREVSALGVPLVAWNDYRYVLGLDDELGLMGFADTVRAMDPTYVDDFWGEPGYLGTDPSPLGDRIRAALIEQETEADGDSTVGLEPRWRLALCTYHRHQFPDIGEFSGWDQFRDAEGRPRYPQRSTLIGPLIGGQVSGGGSHSGKITGKVIVVNSIVDADAYPWHGDWYGARVRSALGADTDNWFRLWFTDNADHNTGPLAEGKQHWLVPYDGVVQQALRDVAAWAERGVPPPDSTFYRLEGGQILLAGTAAVRGGIQPLVKLEIEADHDSAPSSDRGEPGSTEVEPREEVAFRASVEIPAGGGEVVALEWDPLGQGSFRDLPLADHGWSGTHRYPEAGVYFPVLRATTQRQGDASTPFSRVQNLCRVRVVVRGGTANIL